MASVRVRRSVAVWAMALVGALGMGCLEITGVNPDPTEAGARVIIVGTGFGEPQGAGQVLYDGAPLAIVAWADTKILATLPSPKAHGTYTLEVVRSEIDRAATTHVIEHRPEGMVLVPQGPFVMGSEDYRLDERPAHVVTLDSYWIDETEVTADAYAAWLADHIRETHLGDRSPGPV